MEEYSVVLGGRHYELKFTDVRQGIELKRRFGRHPMLLLRDACGLDDSGKITGLMDVELLAAFVLVGIRHLSRKLNEEKVLDWLNEEIKEERSLYEIATPVLLAVMESGILGRVIHPEKDEEPDAGKAPEPKPEETPPPDSST